jgi:hypothetical protein
MNKVTVTRANKKPNVASSTTLELSEKTLCILILRPPSNRMMTNDSVAMYGAKLMIDVESKTPSIDPNIIPKAIKKSMSGMPVRLNK